MTTHLHKSTRAGQAMAEYLIVIAVVTGIFAFPGADGRPLILLFADAIGTGFVRTLGALSLPV